MADRLMTKREANARAEKFEALYLESSKTHERRAVARAERKKLSDALADIHKKLGDIDFLKDKLKAAEEAKAAE